MEQAKSSGAEDEARAVEQTYRPRLLRFLAKRGVFPPDAEDLVQDVFLAVFSQIREGRFRGDSSISTYVISILNNKVADYWKARERRAVEVQMPAELLDGGAVNEPAAPPAGGVDAEGRAILHEILGRLPRQHRVILLLHETERWTTVEIAELLNMNPGTVGRKLWEAKRKLREMGRSSPGGGGQKLLGSGD
jgi:RNA polymerase sigma-70 factor (ECF subfamily)